MSSPYNPKRYWQARLAGAFDLRGVGHIGFSTSYNAWLYRRKRRCIASFFRHTSLTDKDVLDVGCGTGFFVQWYLERGANVCGIDITDVSIERLKRQYGCEFYSQDIADPEYRLNRKFDIVNMWDVVYHIVEPDAFSQAFDNIARSLKDGGLLLFTDWLGCSSDRRIADHVQARCLDTYKQALPRKRFELVGVRPLYHYLNKQNIRNLDDRLGWLYYLMDSAVNGIAADNLSLSVWRFIGTGPA